MRADMCAMQSATLSPHCSVVTNAHPFSCQGTRLWPGQCKPLHLRQKKACPGNSCSRRKRICKDTTSS